VELGILGERYKVLITFNVRSAYRILSCKSEYAVRPQLELESPSEGEPTVRQIQAQQNIKLFRTVAGRS